MSPVAILAEVNQLTPKRAAARPATAKAEKRKPLDSHFKKDESGRIRVEDSDDSDSDAAAGPSTAGPSRGGMGAYVEAMEGEDGHSRDAKGRIRFNKTQGKRSRDRVDDDNDGEVDVPVTEGLKELEIKKRFKKQKKETVHVGNEFKAKVGVGFRRIPETLPLTLKRNRRAARWRRRQEGRYAAVRVRAAPASRRQEIEPKGTETRHHRSQARRRAHVRVVSMRSWLYHHCISFSLNGPFFSASAVSRSNLSKRRERPDVGSPSLLALHVAGMCAQESGKGEQSET